jgi:hypothetical protein
MIGDNKVKDRRGMRLLSEISLYDVYGLITLDDRPGDEGEEEVEEEATR